MATLAGVIIGAVFIRHSQEWVSRFEGSNFEIGDLKGADAKKAVLIIGAYNRVLSARRRAYEQQQQY